MSETVEKETFSFQTEVGQLLEIVAGSLYSNREVFLRELISNASDACDKLRYAALTDAGLAPSQEFAITLENDAKKKVLSISDNGIGMNHADLLETLGTIARSGTNAFVKALTADDKDKPGLIGQFGVGFYSAFMVASQVDVLTRKAGEAEAWLWSSDGKGEFSIEPAERAANGTTVTLHLKKDAKEFAEKARIGHIIKTYSEHVSFPIKLGENTLNAAEALWTRPAKDISEDQYAEFYRQSSHAFDAPWHVMHNRVEGKLNHTSLLFVPSTQPFDLFEPERKNHVKLYVNRVFISEITKDLIPAYLRFLRGVVDSQDLSLNISREMLQTDPQLAKIKTSITKKVLSELKKKANKAPDEYATFWGNFGTVLKEGLVEDVALRDRILELCRFAFSGSGDLTSLTDYVSRMKEGQEAIFYIAGEDAAKLAQSPHLEGFKAKGVEVLLLSDHVDEFWLQHITEFDGKPFKSITRGAADLDEIKAEQAEAEEDKPEEADLSSLIDAIKAELGDAVKDVRPSKRLTDSPVCLIADDGDMDVNLERLLKRHGQLQQGAPRVLELNPSHKIIVKLAERAKDGNDDLLENAAHLLLDQARIVEGEAPADPPEFARRLANVLEKAFAT
ncbi:MAG: molecular chaperone HtpG [Paracoccaceae bacterium]|nr:molecular chaperone HtpG [Paracoccaceae bacterium]MDG1370745.1 molecular chaperone HtpG [Paracoccaceae bacterium]